MLAVAGEPVDEVIFRFLEVGWILPEKITAMAPGVGWDDEKVVFESGVEEIAVGQGIKPDRVETGVPDPGKVVAGVVMALGGKWPVGDGAQKVRPSIEMKVLAVHRKPHGRELERRGREAPVRKWLWLAKHALDGLEILLFIEEGFDFAGKAGDGRTDDLAGGGLEGQFVAFAFQEILFEDLFLVLRQERMTEWCRNLSSR